HQNKNKINVLIQSIVLSNYANQIYSSRYHILNYIMSNKAFQMLKDLPILFDKSQHMLHKHELFICGDNNNKDSNQITLLSFGSNNYDGKSKYTLVIKYISVWNNLLNKLNNYNQWISFTDNHKHPIIIGRNSHLLFITYHPENIS
ncbi:hypothetical protein RFI_31855, partial [Reticulomyxa filosa]